MSATGGGRASRSCASSTPRARRPELYGRMTGQVAIIVDPQPGHRRVLALAGGGGEDAAQCSRPICADDYMTGAGPGARSTGAAWHVGAADKVRSTGAGRRRRRGGGRPSMRVR